jgi:hypothetical protein
MASILIGKSAARVAALSASTIASLTAADIAVLAATQAAALTASQINALSTSAFSAFAAVQIAALSVGAVAGMDAKHIALLSVAQAKGLTLKQIGALSAAQVSALSISAFDAGVATHLSSLTTSAVKGLSTAELKSLTTAQTQGFSSAQIAAMSPAQKTVVMAQNPIVVEARSVEVGGALNYSSMLKLLNDAAVGGMTASKFSGLQFVASQLNVAGGIQTSAYLQQIFDDVVLGNSANATWRGGSATAVALGNLSATTSQTKVNELIGKWFLGADLPSTVVSGMTGVYQAVSAPLFSSAGPLLTDINQGDVGDCYFLAALGETALQNPSLIRNMIQLNPNGTYSVDFHINGQDDYVTVNTALAMMPSGYSYGDGSQFEFDHGASAGAANVWSALIEKAYVQLEAQTGVTPGSDGLHSNAYADVSGGWSNGLSAITGQSVNSYALFAGESAASLGTVLTTLQSAFANKEDVLMASTVDDAAHNIVGDHMYAVTGINVAAGTVSLDNPWNGSGLGTGLQMQFTDSIAALANDSVTFFAATGKAAVA